MASSVTKQTRLHYALWPEETTLLELEGAKRDVVGRKVKPEQLHLTLAFLGNQPIDRLPALAAVLAQLPPQGFVLDLDRYGYFIQQRIAWIGPAEAPLALLDLRASLLRALSNMAPRLKEDSRFIPHVTLARDAERPAKPLAKRICWSVKRIVLVQSLPTSQGVIYSLVAERLLDGAIASVASVAPAS